MSPGAEDEVDWDDDDLNPEDPAARANNDLERTKDQAKPELTLEAEMDMARSTSTNTPKIGASTKTQVVVKGVPYTVTWQVIAVDASTTPSAATVPPNATQTFATRCRFGKLCNKENACPFDHTAKAPCKWVNTPQGCYNREKCRFSHDLEGIICTRQNCSNYAYGRGCGYKHLNDAMTARPKETEKAERMIENNDRLPRGPKRKCETRDDRGRPGQRPRSNNDGWWPSSYNDGWWPSSNNDGCRSRRDTRTRAY